MTNLTKNPRVPSQTGSLFRKGDIIRIYWIDELNIPETVIGRAMSDREIAGGLSDFSIRLRNGTVREFNLNKLRGGSNAKENRLDVVWPMEAPIPLDKILRHQNGVVAIYNFPDICWTVTGDQRIYPKWSDLEKAYGDEWTVIN